MRRIVHGKLVRGKIPQIITADNAQPVTRVLSDAEYRRSLLEKLVEEARELLESDGSLEERADVAEVLVALDDILSFDTELVEEARRQKAEERGGFSERIYLEEVIKND